MNRRTLVTGIGALIGGLAVFGFRVPKAAKQPVPARYGPVRMAEGTVQHFPPQPFLVMTSEGLEPLREDYLKWWEEQLPLRKGGKIIYVQSRLHHADLPGTVLDS